jgi:hypothetical protein
MALTIQWPERKNQMCFNQYTYSNVQRLLLNLDFFNDNRPYLSLFRVDIVVQFDNK